MTAWITATGTRIDAYPDEELWTAEAVEEELLSLQIRLSPIFEDPTLRIPLSSISEDPASEDPASEDPAPPGG